jgi:hypothetical protein
MPSAEALAEGKIERVGSRDDAIFRYKNCQSGFSVKLDKQCIPTYTDGIKKYLDYLTAPGACGVQNRLGKRVLRGSHVERISIGRHGGISANSSGA